MIYLAGPVTGETLDGASEWRDYAKKKFIPYKTISPFRGRLFLLKDNVLQDACDDQKNSLINSKTITRRDKFDCTRADIIFMNLLNAKIVSIGSMVEIGWASQAGIPIVLVMEDSGNVHDHCLVRETCDFRFNNLDDAIKATKIILG